MSKNAIRKRILSRRDTLSPLQVASLSREVAGQFLTCGPYVAASTLVLYASIRSEVATLGIFAAAIEAGKRVLYPRTVGTTLEFVAIESLEALEAGRFGICEPGSGESIPLAEIDLIVLPGVAFDEQGIRLGYGFGCYDRALAAVERPTLVGLAYDFQIVPSLPRETHDVPVDFLVTERRILSM
ncbi:MAG: 5-formyltetrahydrofolate cyclo-ligase [Desulfuromonadales bacterium]|nr:5-formyltetrahydrofolate cyclo-ligase [Desulfuromonadales bacterium]